MDNDIDLTKLKYVLYARKSTDDPERQVRSVEDQIAECEHLAMRLRTIDAQRSPMYHI